MSRRFPNFFDSYQEYFASTFIPPQFQEWACLSIMAAALERKVWLPWSDSWSCHPNMYVLLVSKPGEGKSQSLDNALDLLEDANKKLGGTINILPNQATEAAFIKLLSQGRSFQFGTQIVFQGAAFYRASEASASLRNIYGEFLACLTDLYDCPKNWARATVKDGITPITLKNVCVNLLAGSTFDYLGELVNDKNIMGGFASRLIYVQSKDKPIEKQVFQGGTLTQAEIDERKVFRAALVEDLCAIHRMQGSFTADVEFKKAWEDWYFESETKRKACQSEKLQSLLVRHNLHMLKTSMLFSAAESDDRILKKTHWDRAIKVVSAVMANVPDVFRASRAGDIAGGLKTKNIPHAIVQAIKGNPNMNRETLRAVLQFGGANLRDVDLMLHGMMASGKLALEGNKFRLLGNPDDYL